CARQGDARRPRRQAHDADRMAAEIAEARAGDQASRREQGHHRRPVRGRLGANSAFVTGVIAGPRTEEQWDDYIRALDYRFTAEDEALVDRLVASGHPSTPGFNDPAYPIEGRRARTSA